MSVSEDQQHLACELTEHAQNRQSHLQKASATSAAYLPLSLSSAMHVPVTVLLWLVCMHIFTTVCSSCHLLGCGLGASC